MPTWPAKLYNMNDEVLKAIGILNGTLWQAVKANHHALIISTCEALNNLVKQLR